ncbi:MAG TPA: 1,2-phenylacetyl-CoA epoxidase subunit PaaD [Actinomycetes bacterium]|jgi:ring-1,2-phenylacetyl-CoA epoxidase subunit PaaD|nr:1,2-phenylacetyl-CoA epoxidase subunit PaaD [Actinomycetes bacterium]
MCASAAAGLERRVWDALGEVPDPEIPVVSVVDLGIVRAVEAGPERIRVEMLPTFVGCPALEVIRRSIAERLAGMAERVEVEPTFAEPWTSDRITPEGRRKLRESGFAPPGPPPADEPAGRPLFATIGMRPEAHSPEAREVRCPFCGSRDTALENPFGPTLCRAIFWCNACRQPFEQFKAV